MVAVATIEIVGDPFHHAVALAPEEFGVPVPRGFAHTVLQRLPYAANTSNVTLVNAGPKSRISTSLGKSIGRNVEDYSDSLQQWRGGACESFHFVRPLTAEDRVSMRAFSKTLQHPSFRSAACWTLGFASLVLFIKYILHSAHSFRPTLGAISGLFDGLIWAGREWAAVVESHSSALIATFLVVAAISLALPNVRRALLVRSFAAGILASLLALVSMVNMMEENYGLAVGLALVSGLVLLAGTRNVETTDFTTTYEWPVWIPLGVAVIFRFWSLAEVPRGFAQHAVAHLQISRKLYDALCEVVRSFDFGPMIDWLPYLRDQHGPLSMIDGLGLFVFGVGMVEARMTQAVLGCIAVVVA
jgi:hypothetical protein